MYELKSPLTPHPAHAAAGISPAPVTHSRRLDQAEKRKKNNRPGIAPGRRSLIQFQYFNQDLNRQQEN